MNGWTLTNKRIREDILQALSFDVVGIIETFLKDSDEIELPGYKWFGQNRTVLHSRAVRGSGGIGCFVKIELLQYFDCCVLDSEQEGILILELCNKSSHFKICLYVVYLPPERSIRGRNSDSFFEYLLSKSYLYIDHDLNIVCGDLNARVADKIDYALNVDDTVSDRTCIDTGYNKHGESLLEFCKDSKFLIVNGRVTADKDDFTFVSTRGKSVVDYILTPQTDIDFFEEAKVLLVSDVISEYNLIPPDGGSEGHLPDHSVVCAKVKVHYQKELQTVEVNEPKRYNT